MWSSGRNFGATKKKTKNELPEEEQDTIFKDDSLSTGLKPTFGLKTANNGYDNMEGFLTAVEKPSPRRISDTNILNDRTRKQDKSTKSFRN